MKLELNSITGKIDKVTGTISDISLMKIGPAKGHGVQIDLQTLQDIWELAKSNPVKSYLKHSDNPDPSEAIGLFSSLYINQEDGSLRSAAFQILKAWKEHNPEKYNTLFELAETAPTTFGISLSVAGPWVWKLSDGSEVHVKTLEDGQLEPMPAGATGPFLRVKMIDSADFVSAPAANDSGLFSAKSKPVIESIKIETISKPAKFNMKKIYEKFSANEKALIKAIKFSATDPNLTEDEIIENVELEISVEEQEAIKMENEGLKAKVAELEKTIADLTKDKETAVIENTELKVKLSAKGAKAVQLGVRPSGDQNNDLMKQYEALASKPTEQLSFYRKNAKELREFFF